MIARGVGVVAALLALSGCAANRAATRDLLAQEAGFTTVSASTPDGLRLLRSLPRNRFVARTVNNQTMYYYADPVVCGCVNVGTEAAYQALRQEIAQRQMMRADEMQQLDAQREDGGVNGAGIPLH